MEFSTSLTCMWNVHKIEYESLDFRLYFCLFPSFVWFTAVPNLHLVLMETFDKLHHYIHWMFQSFKLVLLAYSLFCDQFLVISLFCSFVVMVCVIWLLHGSKCMNNCSIVIWCWRIVNLKSLQSFHLDIQVKWCYFKYRYWVSVYQLKTKSKA